MSKTIKAIRGMNDILPADAPYWEHVESAFQQVMRAYAYQQIRFPIVEQTALFRRSIGEVTDIVEKEMYTFEDRNGDSLSLRPEGTACCLRAGLEHGLFHNQLQRLWYAGPMFRHERPQKGRYRQFYQLGAEAIGMAGPDIEAELILMTARFWQALGLQGLTLHLNTLGSSACRARHRDALVAYYQSHAAELDDDSRRRLDKNPLRILDSKNPDMMTLNQSAPTLWDYLDDESQAHFSRLRALLDQAGVSYQVNHHLVRGLDYYSHTVFEWMTEDLGAQSTVCAGGRYDALIAQLGGRETPAVGFAAGMERIVLLLQAQTTLTASTDVYLVATEAPERAEALRVAEALREALPEWVVQTDCAGSSFKSQFKRADKSGARFAVVIGEAELANQQLTLKDLRQGGDQQTMPLSALIAFLQEDISDGI